MLFSKSLGRVVGGLLLTSLFAFTVCGSASAATALRFTNKGVAVVDAQLFPMADGSTGETFRSRLVAQTVVGDFRGQIISGDCYGQGSTSAAGAYLGTVACTMHVSADDAYTWTTADDSSNGGDIAFVVTGGKGRFRGATGRGHYVYDWGGGDDGDRLTWTMETTINLH